MLGYEFVEFFLNVWGRAHCDYRYWVGPFDNDGSVAHIQLIQPWPLQCTAQAVDMPASGVANEGEHIRCMNESRMFLVFSKETDHLLLAGG